ncbi:MAG TPA: signal peptidase II [Parasulfuritortus sp.]
MSRRSGLQWLWLSVLVLVLDQASKLAITHHIALHDAIPLTPFFSLVYWQNTGAAFSLFADQPGWQRGFFIFVALAAVAVILYLLRRTRGRALFCAALAMILGGALGNVIDRFAYGHVVDFLLFHWQDWFYPAFNVADSGITVGAALLIIDSLRKDRP